MSKREPKYMEAKMPADCRCLSNNLPLDHVDFSVKEAIDQHLREKGSEEVKSKGWLYASGMGSCDRQALYNLQEGTPGRNTASPLDQKLSGIGNKLHDMLQDWAIEALGAEEFTAEQPIRFSPLKLSMRVDGVLTLKDWVMEIKTLGNTGYKNLRKPRPEDIRQVHCYMYVLDIPRTILYYINRNTGEDCEFKVYFDYDIWQGILDVIGRVQKHYQDNTKPERITNSFWCSRCRYYEHCMQDA
jgi:CRISPR/Cas system-associated exonuclease Cas4 (RecB family)